MRRSKKYIFQPTKKEKGKALMISLLITSILMTGLVIWIGVNNWNVEKSFKKIGIAIGLENEDDGDDLIGEPGEPEETEEKPDSTPVEDNGVSNEENPEESTTPIDNSNYIEGQKLPSIPTFINGILIANKQYPLPQNYAPGESEEARDAFNEMAAEALLDGHQLTAFSTYRSFDYQTGLYERYVERDGEEAADRYSARPGYSEHQTGLAFDIGEVGGEGDWASSRFGETEAGKWLALNAHRFGFILRYPEGKEKITGYMHESWHFRYVGTELAEEIYKQNITLEEYLGI